jgi:hypothetical protein
MRTKDIIGVFEEFFKGAKTFLAPKRATLGVLNRPWAIKNSSRPLN